MKKFFKSTLFIVGLSSSIAFADITDNLFQSSFQSSMPAAPATTNASKALVGNKSHSKTLINKTVAIVNSKAITSLELDEEFQKLMASIPPTQAYNINSLDIKKEALQSLISQSVLLQLAQQNNIKVSEQELNLAMQDIASKNGVTVKYLKMSIESSGMSFSEYQDKLKDQILINKIQQQAIAQQIHVSQQEINSYIKKHQQTFKQQLAPKKEYLLKNIIIDVPTSKEEKEKKFTLLQKLSIAVNNKDITFSDVAKQFSEAANAEDGGMINQWYSYSDIPSIYKSRIKHLKVGQSSEPFIVDNAIQMVYVDDIKEQKPAISYEVKKYHLLAIVRKITETQTSEGAKNSLKRAILAIQGGKDFNDVAVIYNQDYDHANGDFGWVSTLDSPPIVSNIVINKLRHLKKDELSEPFNAGNNQWIIVKYTEKKTYNASKEIEEQKALEAIYSEKAQLIFKTWITSIKDDAYIQILDDSLKTEDLY